MPNKRCWIMHNFLNLIRRQGYFEVTHDGHRCRFHLSVSEIHAHTDSWTGTEWQIHRIIPSFHVLLSETCRIELFWAWVVFGIATKCMKIYQMNTKSKRSVIYRWMDRSGMTTVMPGWILTPSFWPAHGGRVYSLVQSFVRFARIGCRRCDSGKYYWLKWNMMMLWWL